MENRFGVKDFILFTLLVVLIGIVVLAMFQYDRQWGDIQKIRGRLDEQGRDLRDLQRTLARGVAIASVPGGTGPAVSTGNAPASTNPADYGKDDPFARLKAARAMPGFAEGDWLVEATNEMAQITPLLSQDIYATNLQEFVLETLAQRDPITLAWRPLLATKWEVKENVAAYDAYVAEQKKAGKTEEQIAKDPNVPVPVTMLFTMRDGARFSDGRPVTPDDLVFTFIQIMDERIAAPRHRAYYEKIRAVETVGANQVLFKFKEPYYDIMSLAGLLPALPKHFYSKYKPEEFNQSVGLLMGSGPYRLEDPTSWRPGGGQVVLVRNERYWGTPPALDRIILKEIRNDIAKQTAFRNGEIDIFEARPEQYHQMRSEPDLMRRSQAHDVLSLNGGFRFAAWQQMKDGKPTVFADKRVRRAMTLLVDRKRLVQEVMLGYAELATGPVSPAGVQIDKSIAPLPYDVEAGKRLLAEAGFKDKDGDGVLDTPDGKPFRFKFTFPAGTPNYEKMALAFKDAYARAGIAMDLDPLEWAVFTSKLRNKDFEAITLGWGGGNPESDLYQLFHSKWTMPGGDNFMTYMNPELDKALEAARREIDLEKRIPLWHKCHQILHEDQPLMFLWFTKEMFMVDGRFKNVQAGPLGLPSSVRFEWFVPREQQKRGTK